MSTNTLPDTPVISKKAIATEVNFFTDDGIGSEVIMDSGLVDSIAPEGVLDPSVELTASSGTQSAHHQKLIAFERPYYRHLALRKLADELASFKGENKATAVKNHVAAVLDNMCVDNERFAEAVYRTKGTLSDCCRTIMKGVGSSISDMEVYTKAAKFYFPDSNVRFLMEIETGTMPGPDILNKTHEQKKAAAKPAPKPKPASKAPSAPPPPPKAAKPVEEKPDCIQITLFGD